MNLSPKISSPCSASIEQQLLDNPIHLTGIKSMAKVIAGKVRERGPRAKSQVQAVSS